ncbi:hypothetical protein PG996_010054 [Apiospora saccharicola]|uniref:Uncharacterized protein n=1 Tax=Apiospora saccharicola TaxID=335842 RepID=A0ABR1UQK4_9PEZI
MAVAVAPSLPLEYTPLLSSNLLPKPHYRATMNNLTIVIPPRPASRVSQVLPQPEPEDSSSLAGVSATGSMANNVDEDGSTRRASGSSGSSCTCESPSPLSTHCEYCVRNGLDHPDSHDSRRREHDWMATMEEGRLYTSFSPYPEEHRWRSAWTRCTENEGMLASLECCIELQMRLLAIVVPTALLFILLFVWYENLRVA